MTKANLLDDLVKALVREWGFDDVEKALFAARTPQGKATASTRDKTSARPSPRPLTAVEMVGRADMPPARRQTLAYLASRYDSRTFLPSAADVRTFLEMRGEHAAPAKTRADAFRSVLKTMLRLSDDDLMRMAKEPGHFGPSTLAPIADAIRSAGERLRPSTAPEGSDDRPSVSHAEHIAK